MSEPGVGMSAHVSLGDPRQVTSPLGAFYDHRSSGDTDDSCEL